MTTGACKISEIRLDGDWSMGGVAERGDCQGRYRRSSAVAGSLQAPVCKAVGSG